MARNKKIRRSVGLRKTPRKPTSRSPRVTKTKLVEMREVKGRRRNTSEYAKRLRQQKLLRREIMREKRQQQDNNNTSPSRRVILYPPVKPSPPPAIASTSRSPARRKAARQQKTSATIVIDSEDDNSFQEPPLFFVDTKGGFNEKEVPKYSGEDHGEENQSVMLLESMLEEGEIHDDDDDDEDDEDEGDQLNARINREEIQISDEDEDDCPMPLPMRVNSEDNSVIFCSEVIDLDREDSIKPLDYIPIGFDIVDRRSKKRPPQKNHARKQSKNHPKDGQENRQENVPEKPAEATEKYVEPRKRMVIIDGNNVAYAHTCGQAFSVKGLDICIQYFKKLGHEVKAVVPQYRLKKEKTTDQKLMEELYKNGDVLLSPSKNLPGQKSSSYDDRLIISVAEKFDGVVISNDNYCDLLAENESWKKIIETRVVGYTWAMDAFFLPDDPYGRHGPKLKDMLESKEVVAPPTADK